MDLAGKPIGKEEKMGLSPKRVKKKRKENEKNSRKEFRNYLK